MDRLIKVWRYIMGYSNALKAAGAIVHDYEMFGSYQGYWLADVTLPDGRKGLIKGYYGSCSGCDAFEAEISYDYHNYEDHPDTSSDEFVPGCEKCDALKQKLIEFGAGYFSGLQTPEALAEEYLGDKYWSTYDETPKQAQFVYDRLSANLPVAIQLKARIDDPDSWTD
jgi:hypothetical protein